MGIEFYYFKMSPPSRAVWMVLKELGLEYTEKIIDIAKGEQKSAEYKKISPRQKVPAIKDGDFSVGESRAVVAYLCSQYGTQCGKPDLYPQDPKAKARIDMHLYIDENFMEAILSYVNIGGVLFGKGLTRLENVQKVKDTLQEMENFLTQNTYIASKHFTIADIFSYITLSILKITDYNDFEAYPKLQAWRKKMEALPYHKETCEEPLKGLREFYQKRLQENSVKA